MVEQQINSREDDMAIDYPPGRDHHPLRGSGDGAGL
jgi:hypothetical protein